MKLLIEINIRYIMNVYVCKYIKTYYSNIIIDLLDCSEDRTE